jgi:hypothetical protein
MSILISLRSTVVGVWGFYDDVSGRVSDQLRQQILVAAASDFTAYSDRRMERQ